MDEYIICNTISIYPEAPVSSELFVSNISQVMNAISDKQAAKKYLIADKASNEIMELLMKRSEEFSRLNIEIIEVKVNDHFVFGNSTAVVKLIEGEKAIPSGVDENLPVFSVEDLLRAEEKMVYIGGSAEKQGAFSFAKKIKPREILNQCGSNKNFKGMYFGYPMGSLISAGQLDEEVIITTDSITIFDESDCMLDSLLGISERYIKESCGRCVFGYEGTAQIHMILSDLAQKKGKTSDLELIKDLCHAMQKQSLCDVGVSAGNTILTAMQNFKVEIEEHITKKTCKASVCSKFVTYHVLPDLCNGCNDCQDACEEDAILGKKRFIHVIDQDECTLCGACLEACKVGAIVKAGPIKPRGPKNPLPCKR
ncbi:MAG: 4Fe-4S binding protein [Eubacteriaceae bacterium]|nr:4Fe-4S binding protein [Eubacteriaceae bacterium]